ncbi:MAG: signal peptidase II, partial [Pseudomonadota bacterium]
MLRYLWISGVVIVLDQVTKYLALQHLIRHAQVELLPFLNLTLVFNTGAAFGFLSSAAGWQNYIFTGIAVVASVVIFWMLRGLTRSEWPLAIALTL